MEGRVADKTRVCTQQDRRFVADTQWGLKNESGRGSDIARLYPSAAAAQCCRGLSALWAVVCLSVCTVDCPQITAHCAHANFSMRSATAGNTMGAMGCTAPTSRVNAVHVSSSRSARPPVRCCCPVAPSVGQGLPPCPPALADRVSLCSEHCRVTSWTCERCVEHTRVLLWTRERCRER